MFRVVAGGGADNSTPPRSLAVCAWLSPDTTAHARNTDTDFWANVKSKLWSYVASANCRPDAPFGAILSSSQRATVSNRHPAACCSALPLTLPTWLPVCVPGAAIHYCTLASV